MFGLCSEDFGEQYLRGDMEATSSTTETSSPVKYDLHPLSIVFPGLHEPVQRRYMDGIYLLFMKPSIVLHILNSYSLEPDDLARLETTCSFFRLHAGLPPDDQLCLTELAAFDMCQRRIVLRSMTVEEREALKQQCGGSYKLLLKFLLAGEKACVRREMSQAVAGPGYSVVVTSKGEVYTFGCNDAGQLGHGTLLREERPRLVRSLQGIRIIQAATGAERTLLVSDSGRVYQCGRDSFGIPNFLASNFERIVEPQLVESLNGIFVVQVTIGHYFTALLSREGKVYTLSWGINERLGHNSDVGDREPRLLLGPLEHKLVVQIAAGHCYLLALAFQPNGMSVYSIGCGLGGKLAHSSTEDEKYPRLIDHLATLKLQPIALAAGSWHAVVLGQDGRVCTWGWGNHGCLGHGDQKYQVSPMLVEDLSLVKATHIAAGRYTTFVVAENGDIYSFGSMTDSNLGYPTEDNYHLDQLTPKLVTSLPQADERIIQFSTTKDHWGGGHTFALTESGKLYAFGIGYHGQLGIKLPTDQTARANPERVDIDLSQLS